MIPGILKVIEGILWINILIQEIQCSYIDAISYNKPSSTDDNDESILFVSKALPVEPSNNCQLKRIIDMKKSYDTTDIDAKDSATSNQNKTVESNLRTYDSTSFGNNAQNIPDNALNTHSSNSMTMYPSNKGEILIHRPATIIVKRPPTKVVVNHPPLVVKPAPVVLHKPPAVVMHKVYVKQHPRPIQVEPVYVNVVKPPAEKYFVKEKLDSGLYHQKESEDQKRFQYYYQVNQPTGISTKSNEQLKSTLPALQSDGTHKHTFSSKSSHLHHLFHLNQHNDGVINYDAPHPSVLSTDDQEDASSY